MRLFRSRGSQRRSWKRRTRRGITRMTRSFARFRRRQRKRRRRY